MAARLLLPRDDILNQVPASFRPFAEALLGEDDPAPGLIQLLGTLGRKTAPEEARDFALLLRRALPPSARRDRVSEVFLRESYPAWYIRAVNDRHRNAAYCAAIETAVTPRSIVLETGTGSGLFAMMAARAGATHVYTCEKDPHVAEIARLNIARNGFRDKITVLESPHEELRVGEHIPRRADILLHEFVASHFMVKEIPKIISRLRNELLTDDAVLLPSRFSAIGKLIGDPWPLDLVRVPDTVEGLDVSAINILEVADVSLPGPVTIETPLSAPVTLADFDPCADDAPTTDRVVEIEATGSGAASGLLQWVRYEFPDGSVYENRPDLACHWWPYFWPFANAVPVRAGDRLPLKILCSETEVFIDLVTDSRDD